MKHEHGRDGSSPGDRRRRQQRPAALVVSVTDADGVPVSGLAAADFTIDATIVARGGSQVEIGLVRPLVAEGRTVS